MKQAGLVSSFTLHPSSFGACDALRLSQPEEPQGVARAGLLPAAAGPAALAQPAGALVVRALRGGRGGGGLSAASLGTAGAGGAGDIRPLDHRQPVRALPPGGIPDGPENAALERRPPGGARFCLYPVAPPPGPPPRAT